MIAEHYDARQENLRIAGRGDGAEDGPAVYKPVPPSQPFLDQAWQRPGRAHHRRAVAVRLLDAAPDGAVDAGKSRWWISPPPGPIPTDLFTAAADRVAREARGRRVLVTAHSAGSRERILTLFTPGLDRGTAWETWADVARCRTASRPSPS